MKKNLLFLLAILAMIGCQSTCGDKTDVTPVEKTPTEVDPPEEEIETPEEPPDILEVPEDFAEYLSSKMPGYKIVEREKWLLEEYVESFEVGYRPRYSDDIFIEGDFNGDYEDDYATFLEDSKGRMGLYVFHRNKDSFKRFKLSSEKGSGGILGAGIETGDAGFIVGDNKESSGLEYNTVNYKVYEETGSTYYWNGRRYKKVKDI